jgi:arylsulfatase A-like enzyme
MRFWCCLVGLILPVTLCAEERPNLVIMMCDDQRADAMSCAGNPVIKTPNMDRLAKEGMRFTHAFVTNALCAPSRATLLSGLYSHANGVADNFGRAVPADIKLLPDYLRAAGYEVAFCGKSHMKNALRDRTWDYYFGYKDQGRYVDPIIAEGVDGKDKVYPGYMDDVVTEHALKWMKQPRSKPFCLFLFFKAPHRQWVP